MVLTLQAAAHAVAGVSVTSDGSALAKRVADAIKGVDLGPAASVSAAAKGGVVTLSGWTATLAARERLAFAVEAVPGVTFSYPNVSVRPSRAVSDSDVRSRVDDAVRAAVPGGGVSASVSGGVVRLTGSVPGMEEAEDAVRAVKGVEGVVRISNEIQLAPVLGSITPPVEPQRMFTRTTSAAGTMHATDVQFTAGGVSGKPVASCVDSQGKTNVLVVDPVP